MYMYTTQERCLELSVGGLAVSGHLGDALVQGLELLSIIHIYIYIYTHTYTYIVHTYICRERERIYIYRERDYTNLYVQGLELLV